MALLRPLAGPDDRLVGLYLANLRSPESRRTQASALGRIAGALLTSSAAFPGDPAIVPWSSIRRDHVLALRSALEAFAPATQGRYLAALRGVLREAWRERVLSEADYRLAIDAARPAKGAAPRPGRHVEAEELEALLTTCAADAGPSGRRDAAMLAVLFHGLRRAEVVGLDREDFDGRRGRLEVRRGKGGRSRPVWLKNGAADAMAAWLAVRGDESGPLFPAIRKGGHMTGERMRPVAVLKMAKKRTAQARMAGAEISEWRPHDARRSFCGGLLGRSVDISKVARLAGHSTVTARYDRRPEAELERACEAVAFPYVAPDSGP